MATLATSKARKFVYTDAVKAVLPVVATDILYRGSALGLSTVSARPLSAGDTFLGFADETIDNSAGAAGDKSITVVQRGIVVVAVTGASDSTAPGTTVYASDDDTFTLSSTSNSAIGKVVKNVSSTTCEVYFESAMLRSI